MPSGAELAKRRAPALLSAPLAKPPAMAINHAALQKYAARMVDAATTTPLCLRCGIGRQHAVPTSWRPPGWFWCT